MSELNTLFILAKWGLKKVVDDTFETHMWLLDDQEASMKYISLHKSKADRATKGGKILNIRPANMYEIETHQSLLAKNGIDPMKNEKGRKIIEFKLDQKWNAIWPKKIRTNPMAYKGLGYVEGKTIDI